MRISDWSSDVCSSDLGGGFGGKLDISVQPLIALAAWLLDRPVRCEYTRPESMAATTKRHASRVTARAGCDRDGKLTALVFDGAFDTGAYASWGPTVADRVPVHCSRSEESRVGKEGVSPCRSRGEPSHLKKK